MDFVALSLALNGVDSGSLELRTVDCHEDTACLTILAEDRAERIKGNTIPGLNETTGIQQ